MAIDLTNLDVFEDGSIDQIFEQMRKESPVYWNECVDEEGFWALTRYEDALWAWKKPEIFSSERGNMLRLRGRRDPAAGKMMVVTDPPAHTVLRGLLNHGFTPQSIQVLEPQIRLFICELLDSLEPGHAFDFVTEVATKLPVGVTCSLMGIPRSDWKLIADLSVSSFAAEDPEYWKGASVEETLAVANAELLCYFFDLIDTCREKPGEGLIHTLANLYVDGHRLSDEEIALNCFSFLLGGNETTRYATAGGILAFIENPAEAERLAKDRSVIKTAVEEILRWTTPNAHVLRTATQDIELHGHQISKGDVITLWSASANRDEMEFINPKTFNITRTPNRHVAFGYGAHYCIGANLARLEIKNLFLEIAERDYHFELVNTPIRLRSNFLSGFKHLFVKLHEGRQEPPA